VYELLSSYALPQRRGGSEGGGAGVQLKRMESGSLLAICAMCLSMSFLVMIPSSLLTTDTKKRRVRDRGLRITLCRLRHVKSEH